MALLLVPFAAGACQGQHADDGSQAAAPAPSASSTSMPEGIPDGPHRILKLRFNAESGLYDNSGEAPLKVEPVTWGAGAVRTTSGPQGPAVRFPRYGARPGIAIIRVVNAAERDWLRPEDRRFAFGARFELNRRSDGSSTDDGNNLLQRGLFESPSLYKIQVDHHRVSCLVRGTDGEVLVRSPTHVRPATWYRVRCERRGDTLMLQVAEMGDDEAGAWTTKRASGPIGSVVMPAQTPLAVGGKLSADGSLTPSSTDQFNGAIDQVFLRVWD